MRPYMYQSALPPQFAGYPPAPFVPAGFSPSVYAQPTFTWAAPPQQPTFVPAQSAPAVTEPPFSKRVCELIGERHCTRAFLRDKPVPLDIIQAVLTAARGAPSSQDTQPWQVTVLSGKARDGLSAKLLEAHEAKAPLAPDYPNRPAEDKLPNEMKERGVSWGTKFFDAWGLARDDLPGRNRQRGLNFQFFNAPVELIFHLPAGSVAGTFLDMGMFIQNVLTGFRAFGIGTCPQYSVATLAPVVRDYLGMGDARVIVCGMCVGYADPAASINTFAAERAPLQDYATFLDDSFVPGTKAYVTFDKDDKQPASAAPAPATQ